MLSQSEVILDAFSAKGRATGSLDNCKVEVFGGAPGDTALVALGRKRKGKRQGILQEVLRPSSLRTTPLCKHAGVCGGCCWQHIDYAHQLRLKQEVIERMFSEFSQAIVYPIIPCDPPFHYRNKMEFSFSQNKAKDHFLGLMMGGSDKVLNLEECHLTSKWFSDIVIGVRNWWKKTSLAAYHHYQDTGSLRTLTLREGYYTKDKMVILTVSGNPDYAIKKEDLDTFVKEVRAVGTEGGLSIFLRIHQIQKGSPTQFFEHLLYGKDHIKEKLNIDEGFLLTISPDAFFQPNTRQAEKLYRRAKQMLSGAPSKTLLDLYCGTGTIGMVMSKYFDKVVGLEINPYAVIDAKANLEANRISNMEVHQGDVAQVLKELGMKRESGEIDAVIVDPPRSGLDDKAIAQIGEISPKMILYISCHPKTQVDNIKSLEALGYQLVKVHPVDQFPHTVHVENIALLQRRGFFS